MLSMKHGKSDEDARSITSQGFEISPFGFSTFELFIPATEELLDRVCRRYASHAHIPSWEAHPRVYG